MRGVTSASRDPSTPTADDPGAAADFLSRWQSSGSAERANYQLFLSELCDLLHVPRPDPTRPDDRDNAYVFERSVHFDHGDGTSSTGRIDLYKRGCFVLEAKQGSAAAEGPALFRYIGHVRVEGPPDRPARRDHGSPFESSSRSEERSSIDLTNTSNWLPSSSSDSSPSSPAIAALANINTSFSLVRQFRSS